MSHWMRTNDVFVEVLSKDYSPPGVAGGAESQGERTFLPLESNDFLHIVSVPSCHKLSALEADFLRGLFLN